MEDEEEEKAPQKIHHFNGMGIAKEMASCTTLKVAMVEEVDQSFLVAGCCYCHGMTQGLELEAFCAAWMTEVTKTRDRTRGFWRKTRWRNGQRKSQCMDSTPEYNIARLALDDRGETGRILDCAVVGEVPGRGDIVPASFEPLSVPSCLFPLA